ncbi:MAG: GAF domain-containing protein [Aromatoleum sp.]|nr:GAF domain-containing protein [Aromatoleum sp.]
MRSALVLKKVPRQSPVLDAPGAASITGKLNDFAWICALYELGQTAAAGVDPLKVQQDILKHIVSGLDAESGSIALIVEGTDDLLEIVAGTDLPPGTVGSRLPRGVGVFGHVVATGQPLLINGDAAETRLPVQINERRDRATHSAMCWPLRVQERTIGALAVNRAAGLPKYSVEDLDRGQVLTSLLALVMANHRMHVERENRILELSTLNDAMQRMNALLEDAQNQLIQSEKLASIGQIAAGVAHEINNPVGFVLSNLGALESYVGSLFALAEAADAAGARSTGEPSPEGVSPGQALRDGTDIEFLRTDIAALLAESRDGLGRVKAIVQDLKNFSRGGADESWELVDLHAALESTLNIVRNEIKYKARIETRYGALPEVECLPSRLNQVFLNLLVNAGQAIEANGRLLIETGVEGTEAWIAVEDTGCGIPKEHLNRIFEPFFTTKPVGQGTGLGLSLSYSIVRKHGGRIDVDTEVGRGTRFTVRLPLRQPRAAVPATSV